VSAREPLRLSVCVECLLVLASGVETAEQQRAADGMAARWSGFILAHACPPECEGWFSHRSCEGCGDPLSGERHEAVAWPAEDPS
jgi:hypothetical protein